MTSPVIGAAVGRRRAAGPDHVVVGPDQVTVRHDRVAAPARRHEVAAPGDRRRRVPTAVWVVAAVFAVFFTAATIQSYLITGQRTLDHLQKQIDQAKLRQDDLRRSEIDLRSPAQVAQTAMNDLKMVHAAPPVLLTPEPVVIGSATPQTAPQTDPSTAPADAAAPLASGTATSVPAASATGAGGR